MTGWQLEGWKPKAFLGATPAQVDALHALMWALHEHVGIPLVCPGDVPDQPKLIKRAKRFKPDACPPGWYHHCYGVTNRWDHLGLHLTSELMAAYDKHSPKAVVAKPKKSKSKKTKA